MPLLPQWRLAGRLGSQEERDRFRVAFFADTTGQAQAGRDRPIRFGQGPGRGGDGHYAKTANFLTGLHVQKTIGKDINVGGVSVDQVVAQKIGDQTPLPSLELGIDPVISGTDSVVGYTRLYGSYISWRTAGAPLAKEINPRMVYERLFGAKDASARGRDDDRSLLDMTLEDARNLRGRLGRDDLFKLDEYLDAIRAVERRLEFASKPDPRPWKPERTPDAATPPAAGIPHGHREHVKLMLDLMVLAFWSDDVRHHFHVRQRRVQQEFFLRRWRPRQPSRHVAPQQ